MKLIDKLLSFSAPKYEKRAGKGWKNAFNSKMKMVM